MNNIIMKQLIIIFLIILFYKPEKSVPPKEKHNQDSFITIVFINPKITDTVWYNKSTCTIISDPIYYRIEGSFINKKINLVKNQTDTIKIITQKNIYLCHSYGLNYSSTYVLKPGDFLEFEYHDNIPFLKNKKDKINHNFQSVFNSNNPINQDEMEFFAKYNRFKSKEEKQQDSLALVLRNQKEKVFFDSIRAKMEISEEDYNLYMLHIINKYKLENKNPKELLQDTYNLSISSNTFLVKNAFERINKPKLIRTSNGTVFDYLLLYNKALNTTNISEYNKAFLLFTYLDNIAQNYSKEQFSSCFEAYKKTSYNTELLDYFKNNYPKLFNNESVGKTNIALVDMNNNQITLKQILNKNKGKVIYLDFWASWCAPCRAILPKSHELMKEFKDKNVVFVYISIDDNFKQWKTAATKENLLANSYITKDYPYAAFYKDLNLKSIPRYLIYDINSKLVNNNAPNPEGNDIRKEFIKLIEN